MKQKRKLIFIILLGLVAGASLFYVQQRDSMTPVAGKPLKWVEFNVPYEALSKAMEEDVKSYKNKIHIDWIDVLAYLGAKYGGEFSSYQSSDMDTVIAQLKDGKKIKSITAHMEYFNYYHKAYSAVLGGLLGSYKIQVPDPSDPDKKIWKHQYGLKGFSPIAEGYWYSDYDDFGVNRSYGYSRRHLGHDLMIGTGTPIVSVESGTVEALGWNQYGGWRVGIRSFDNQRYYYYAHLQKDHPFAENLYIGKSVSAGDVIGYSGQTGYSLTENTNNIDTPHLHYGMQLVFEEKAKDSPNQIWIDMYAITKLLSTHKSTVYKKDGEYYRKYAFSEKSPYLKEHQSQRTTPASTSVKQKKKIPIIMYHSLLKDVKMHNNYVISPERLKEDLVYLKKHGYTTVLMEDLIDYVNQGAPLPKKPILLTFDDGYYNNYFYAYPLLKKYESKAVISIIGKQTDIYSKSQEKNPYYTHLTWKQIQKMTASGLVEIENHSYNLHKNGKGRKGITQKRGENYKSYKKFLKRDLMKLQNKLQSATGVWPTTFTYPFGAASENSKKAIKQLGFQATLGCAEGVSVIAVGNPNSLYDLKRYLRPYDKSGNDFFESLHLK